MGEPRAAAIKSEAALPALLEEEEKILKRKGVEGVAGALADVDTSEERSAS